MQTVTAKTKGRAPIGHLSFQGDDELPQDAFAFQVVGNCMAPEILDQDYIVCDPHGSLQEGDIVAFHHCLKGFLVKRLVTIEGEQYFKANDIRIEPIKVSPECKVAGKVIKVVHT